MTEQEAKDYLDAQAARSGAKVEQSDITNLAGKKQEDVAKFQQDLATQYDQRGSNKTFSAGGTGGSADENQDGKADDGWTQNAGGQWEKSGSSAGSSSGSSVASAWNNTTPGAPGSVTAVTQSPEAAAAAAQQAAAAAEAKSRADALYAQLNQRATQGLNVSADDPLIKGQVDAFRNEQERARRNFVSDTAERSGSLANIQGERRLAAERVGQGTSSFQAELMAREAQSKRDEIAQALSTQAGLLTGDQTRALQMQLAQMDDVIKRLGLDSQNRGLDIQDKLGMGGLENQRLGINNQNDQFLRELALRQWQSQLADALGWANVPG